MSIASNLPKSKKPKQLSPSVGRADTPLYGVELAATDLKSLRELPADANVMIVSVGHYPKLKLPKSKTKGFWRMRLVNAKDHRKTDKISPLIKASAFQPGARARALLRGAEAIAEDLKAAGGTFDLESICSLTRLTRQAIHKQVTDGRLLAVPGPSNRNVYPVVQFNSDGKPVEGLKEVRDALGSRSPWMLLNFLVNPEARLDNRKPIDLLRAGKLGAVIEAARHVGLQGA
ncbi:hypothetical protein BH10PSE6_BH10PSE6_34420 [soil metagenome]